MTPSSKDADCIFTSPCEVQLYLNFVDLNHVQQIFGNTEQKQTTVFQQLTCLNRGDCWEWELFGSPFVGNLTTLYDSLGVTNTL